jgi:hypothetical protein
MAGTYAKDTAVSVERSRGEIERTLERYGATAFMYGSKDNVAVVGFEIEGRRYRIKIALPRAAEFTRTPTGRQRKSAETVMGDWRQAICQRWRALALWIKATLEAAEVGIVTLDEALVPFAVLPDGRTVGEWLMPQVGRIAAGELPPMLPGLPAGDTVDGEVV